jgi:hypothetical protein
MAYKVLDLYKELPGSNCGECGKGSCFAFATVALLEGVPLAVCPHLSPEARASMQEKLDATRAAGQGKKEASHVQALNFLRNKIRDADFSAMARNSVCRYLPGPPEALEIPFLGVPHLVRTEDVAATIGEPPSVWVQVFLYIYATRANGNPPAGRWVAFRELPNTVSKSKNFEAAAEEVARAFDGREEELRRAALSLGGREVPFGSADLALCFQALPRIELLLLYWRAEEEFGARAALLVDAGILDYLDQEAIVFLAEAVSRKLRGRTMNDVIP